MIGWIISLMVILIIIILIIRRVNSYEEDGDEHKSRFRKFLDACCLHS